MKMTSLNMTESITIDELMTVLKSL